MMMYSAVVVRPYYTLLLKMFWLRGNKFSGFTCQRLPSGTSRRRDSARVFVDRTFSCPELRTKKKIYTTHTDTSKSIEQLLLIWLLLHILMPKSHSTIKIGFYQDAVATQQSLLNETQALLQPERKDEILERCNGEKKRYC